MEKILKYSIDKELRHIPSALSQYSYLKHILPKLDYDEINFVVGKPFGSQAYYVVWDNMGLLEDKNYHYALKHEELPMVKFSEETLGNALGVACGIHLANKKPTVVNISDGAIQMGPTLEAIQFIGAHKHSINCLVDCNGYQLTGSTEEVISQGIEQIRDVFETYGWRVVIIECRAGDINVNVTHNTKPTAYLFKTRKGQGVEEMENDPVGWHYKQLRSLDEITIK